MTEAATARPIRAVGLNFLAAVVIYHNTLMLGEILADPEVSSTLGRPTSSLMPRRYAGITSS